MITEPGQGSGRLHTKTGAAGLETTHEITLPRTNIWTVGQKQRGNELRNNRSLIGRGLMTAPMGLDARTKKERFPLRLRARSVGSLGQAH